MEGEEGAAEPEVPRDTTQSESPQDKTSDWLDKLTENARQVIRQDPSGPTTFSGGNPTIADCSVGANVGVVSDAPAGNLLHGLRNRLGDWLLNAGLFLVLFIALVGLPLASSWLMGGSLHLAQLFTRAWWLILIECGIVYCFAYLLTRWVGPLGAPFLCAGALLADYWGLGFFTGLLVWIPAYFIGALVGGGLLVVLGTALERVDNYFRRPVDGESQLAKDGGEFITKSTVLCLWVWVPAAYLLNLAQLAFFGVIGGVIWLFTMWAGLLHIRSKPLEMPSDPEANVKRPKSVTVVGVTVLVLASILIALLMWLGWLVLVLGRDISPPPTASAVLGFGFYLAYAALVAAVSFASGIGILKGREWARLLLLTLVPLCEVVNWIVYSFPQPRVLVMRTIIYFVALVVLTGPAASRYFASTKNRSARREVPSDAYGPMTPT